MGVASYVVFFRVLAPVLLTYMAWVVWRTPYQERENRLLAAFLAVLAFGFWMELFWDISLAQRGDAVTVLRRVQDLAGLVDPPILLLFALVLTGRDGRMFLGAVTAAYLVAGSALWLAGGVEEVAGTDSAKFAGIIYTNVTYLLAFVLLWRAFVREERRFRARQLDFLTLGVGFAALSRMSAIVLTGGPRSTWQTTIESRTAWSLVLALATLLILAAVFLAMQSAWRRPLRRVTSPAFILATILAAFFGFWYLLLRATGPTPFQPLASYFFGFRWVIFAGIVGYGVLRYQLFDFELRSRQVVTLFGVTLGGISVGLVAGLAAEGAGLSILAARLTGLAAMLVLGVPTFGVLYRAAGRSGRHATGPRFERRRLEIYQATLEYALQKPTWTDDERRFVETLREVFEVTPEEHEQVVERLKGAPAQHVRSRSTPGAG